MAMFMAIMGQMQVDDVVYLRHRQLKWSMKYDVSKYVNIF